MKLSSHITALLLGVSAITFTSCTDTWGDHYNAEQQADSRSVAEIIASDPQLTTFARMVEISGYGPLLASTQAFTVFAPVNEALADVDLNNADEVKRIVANHMARFNNSTATNHEKGVKMHNGKRFHFGPMAFGGAPIATPDIVAANGIIHKMQTRIPYAYNLREYIDTHAETSRFAEFLKQFDTVKLDLDASTPIGVDEKGNTVYDSVLVNFNPILDAPVHGLGGIANEDSTFTMIIPDNRAWDDAYRRISPFFKVADTMKEKADSLTRLHTSLAIVEDLVYRKTITDPAGESNIFSTSGSKIADVASLFAGTTPMVASNGMIYLASTLNYDNTATFNKPIRVEGETQAGRTPASSTTLIVKSVDTSNPFADEISELRYLEVTSTSTSRQPGVTFSLPGVLSGTYDIYVVTVPGNVMDNSVTNDSTRLQFTLTYQNTNGSNKTANFRENSFLTSPTKVTMMKVASEFTFPVANHLDRLRKTDETYNPDDFPVTTTLYVTTNVSNTEFNKGTLTRRFRIDSILLVPVKK